MFKINTYFTTSSLMFKINTYFTTSSVLVSCSRAEGEDDEEEETFIDGGWELGTLAVVST